MLWEINDRNKLNDILWIDNLIWRSNTFCTEFLSSGGMEKICLLIFRLPSRVFAYENMSSLLGTAQHPLWNADWVRLACRDDSWNIAFHVSSQVSSNWTGIVVTPAFRQRSDAEKPLEQGASTQELRSLEEVWFWTKITSSWSVY